MTKSPPRYLSKKKLVRYGSVKKLTKSELISLAKKKQREKRNPLNERIDG